MEPDDLQKPGVKENVFFHKAVSNDLVVIPGGFGTIEMTIVVPTGGGGENPLLADEQKKDSSVGVRLHFIDGKGSAAHDSLTKMRDAQCAQNIVPRDTTLQYWDHIATQSAKVKA